MTLALETDYPKDFDFFIGSWNIAHRRLKERLVGCEEWAEFAGKSEARHLLGGYGNVDDNQLFLPEGTYRAVTLRSYNPESRSWSIWWLDGRHPGTLDTPVVGSFVDGVGTFYATDEWKGQPIRVRFTWTVQNPDEPRWEQAFSTDNGATWETNWTMAFSRSQA